MGYIQQAYKDKPPNPTLAHNLNSLAANTAINWGNSDVVVITMRTSSPGHLATGISPNGPAWPLDVTISFLPSYLGARLSQQQDTDTIVRVELDKWAHLRGVSRAGQVGPSQGCESS
jgi:hypothetical protein